MTPTKRSPSRAVTWALVFISMLAALFILPLLNMRCCGEPPSPAGIFFGILCVMLCIGSFLICPRHLVVAKGLSFILLWPAIFRGLEVTTYRFFTPDVLRFFHRWNF